MELTRRSFFKATGLALAGSMAFELSAQSQAFAMEADEEWKLVNTEEYTNICCYCSGGCGSVVSVRDGEIISVEGDPDHVINEGGLCPKGAAMFQLVKVVDPATGEVINNPNRHYSPLVRRPGASDWEEISWEDAIDGIARHVKETRDKYFIEKDEDGVTVNRLEAIGHLGGSQQNSEEEYLILKFMRGLGVVAVDNQARV
jgi:formate dehydrogenase major subunit